MKIYLKTQRYYLTFIADNNIDKVAEVDSRAQVNTTGRFNANSTIPSVGKDNAFIQTALNLEQGKTSGPVRGLRGNYVIHLTEKTNFDSSAYTAQSSVIRNNLIQEKQNMALSTWLTELKERADIEDNRYMFYGY